MHRNKRVESCIESNPPYALLRAGFPYIKTIGMIRTTPSPVDIAVLDKNNLFVLCRGRGVILNSVDDDYPLRRSPIGGNGDGDGQFVWPTTVILDQDQNLYVSDEALNRVTIFDREGNFKSKWGSKGDQEGKFNRLSGIAFDDDENIYTSDSLNHRVQKITKNGEFIAKWGGFGSKPGQFNMPWGIHVDYWGYVYVADWRNSRIQKFSGSGEFVFELTGSPNDKFNRPSGVAVDRHGDIYVADRENHCIKLFDKEGRYVEKFVGDATISKSGRTYLMSNPGPLRQRESTELEIQKRFRGPVSVRIDDNYNMYVPDYGSSRVQIYKKEAYPLGPDEIAPTQRSPRLYTM